MPSELKFCGGRACAPLLVATIVALFGAGAAGAAEVAPMTSAKDGLMTFPNVRVVNAPQAGAAPAQRAMQPGFKAYIDPATGSLRGPTEEELQQESADGLRAHATLQSKAAPLQFPTKSGAIGLALDESTMMFSVVQRADDGSLNEFCVTGADQATKLMTFKAPASAALNRKEVRNDR